ncbi:hypothetical protein FACS1894122_14490 [Alphaproteobacteria bacterium]|nr:hypothetical protein FACS1894122_14490 [Alphaproteobacteria bacterium]
MVTIISLTGPNQNRKSNPHKRSKTTQNSKILDAIRGMLALLLQHIRRLKSYNS